ncbi:MAG: hypothetical protein ACKPKO_52365, partial [Candidatus Fonsibacter sp.]
YELRGLTYNAFIARRNTSIAVLALMTAIAVVITKKTPVYIADITIPASWSKSCSKQHNIVYFLVTGAAYSASRCLILRALITSITLAQTTADAVNTNCPFGLIGCTVPSRFLATGNMASNTYTLTTLLTSVRF